MIKGYGKIASAVYEAINSTVEELGYFIWDIEFIKQGSDKHLIITIDSDDGIDINDCEKVHQAVNPILDEVDPIPDAYYLDVSSPGLERSIRLPEHFEKCVGEKVEFKLFAQVEGTKSVIGELIAYDNESDKATVREKTGTEYVIERKLISKANTYFEM